MCDDFDRYFDLWLESDIEQFNTEYEVQKLAPGFLAFATNGGGELYVFNQTGQIFELPCIGMDPQYASLLAESWGEFESRIRKTGESGGGDRIPPVTPPTPPGMRVRTGRFQSDH